MDDWPHPGNSSSVGQTAPSLRLLTALLAATAIILTVLLVDSRQQLEELRAGPTEHALSEPLSSTERPGDGIGPNAEQAEVAQGEGEARTARLEKDFPNATPEELNAWVQLEGGSELGSAIRRHTHSKLAEATQNLANHLPGLAAVTPIRVELVQRPLWNGETPRVWIDASWAPQLEFPISGITQTNDAELEAAATNLIARALLRKSAGAEVPGWFLIGLPAYLEQGAVAAEDWSQWSAQRRSLREVSSAPGAASAEEEQLCRAFVSFLVERSGWEHIDDYVRALSLETSPEGAALRALGAPLTDLEQEWVGRPAP